jgi:hypothetical protein
MRYYIKHMLTFSPSVKKNSEHVHCTHCTLSVMTEKSIRILLTVTHKSSYKSLIIYLMSMYCTYVIQLYKNDPDIGIHRKSF